LAIGWAGFRIGSQLVWVGSAKAATLFDGEAT